MNISLNKINWGTKLHKKLDPAKVEWKGKVMYYDSRELVASKTRKLEVLKHIFEGVDTPYGINALQKVLSRDYIGITQKDLREFLHSHESWQLKKPTRYDSKDHSFIYQSKPGFLEVDYTFRPEDTKFVNGNRNYILTCIDRFSRYAWVSARPNKTA
jgi:hypothetical protein